MLGVTRSCSAHLRTEPGGSCCCLYGGFPSEQTQFNQFNRTVQVSGRKPEVCLLRTIMFSCCNDQLQLSPDQFSSDLFSFSGHKSRKANITEVGGGEEKQTDGLMSRCSSSISLVVCFIFNMKPESKLSDVVTIVPPAVQSGSVLVQLEHRKLFP